MTLDTLRDQGMLILPRMKNCAGLGDSVESTPEWISLNLE